MDKTIYCGWDGGGTKTEVLCEDAAGSVLLHDRFGSLNVNGAGKETVRHTIHAMVQAMRAAFPTEQARLCIGMAGISNAEAVAWVHSCLQEAGFAGQYRLIGDQEAALAGAIDGCGAVLIAGTGSICCGRDRDGKLYRCGGWGHLIDDGGSGYAIGRDILAAVVRAADGRLPATVLTDAVMAHLQIDSIHQLIQWVYAPTTDKKAIASMAILLQEAVEKQDMVALRIAENASLALSELVLTLWHQMGIDDGELALCGSILEHMPWVQEPLKQAVHTSLPKVQTIRSKAAPVYGAVKLARERWEHNA